MSSPDLAPVVDLYPEGAPLLLDPERPEEILERWGETVPGLGGTVTTYACPPVRNPYGTDEPYTCEIVRNDQSGDYAYLVREGASWASLRTSPTGEILWAATSDVPSGERNSAATQQRVTRLVYGYVHNSDRWWQPTQ